jgi:peptide/nickel transport system permease protein
MGLFLLQRFTLLLATLAFASIVVFGVLEILPGNAAQVMLGASATPETVAALAHRLGLDQGFGVRYLAWIGDP